MTKYHLFIGAILADRGKGVLLVNTDPASDFANMERSFLVSAPFHEGGKDDKNGVYLRSQFLPQPICAPLNVRGRIIKRLTSFGCIFLCFYGKSA